MQRALRYSCVNASALTGRLSDCRGLRRNMHRLQGVLNGSAPPQPQRPQVGAGPGRIQSFFDNCMEGLAYH